MEYWRVGGWQEKVMRRGRWLEVNKVLEQAASLYGAFMAGCQGRGSRNVRHCVADLGAVLPTVQARQCPEWTAGPAGTR
jgi:hypothetical protein